MEIPAVVVAVLGALAGPVASVKVASVQAGRTLDDLTRRIAAVESMEPATQAKLREDVDALAADVAGMRYVVDRLAADLGKALADDEKRRDKAADRAEQRERREREQETALAARLATVHTLLDTLRQEIRDARPR